MESEHKKVQVYQDEPHNNLAIISLVAGVAAWVIVPILGAIVGVICGHLARGQLLERPHETSSIMALLGLILSYVQLVLATLLIGFVAWFGWALLQGVA